MALGPSGDRPAPATRIVAWDGFPSGGLFDRPAPATRIVAWDGFPSGKLFDRPVDRHAHRSR
ncbi:MAG: hypothetical protein M0Z49_06340, partial [Chloroflexi bacterium]|nr:hypothetical protein [Chloroflexota bacterium]